MLISWGDMRGAKQTLALIQSLTRTALRDIAARRDVHAGPETMWTVRILNTRRPLGFRTLLGRWSDPVGRAGHNSQALILWLLRWHRQKLIAKFREPVATCSNVRRL